MRQPYFLDTVREVVLIYRLYIFVGYECKIGTLDKIHYVHWRHNKKIKARQVLEIHLKIARCLVGCI